MKRTLGKRLLALMLTLCLLITLFPAYLPSEAEAVSGVDNLTCAGFISNLTRRNYIDVMMKYYINNYTSLQSALNSGKSVVFMFEGGSDYYDSYAYVDGSSQVRLQAVCIVVQTNSSGNAEIVFYSEECSSIPDNANYVTPGYETSGSTTILDGIYKMTTVNHNGNYAAHTTDCSTGWYNPYAGSTGYSAACNGINIHTRYSYYNGSTGGNSMGCQLIGYGANSGNHYNAFMKTVAGVSFNAYSSSYTRFSSWGTYTGYYVVDRQLGLLSPGGTEYGSGSLIELYTKADLAGITKFSTNARANASFGYTSKCTFYPSHCQIKVTLDGAPINTQPCSVSTVNESETIATAALGATYTATGMYRNEYDNLWYRIDIGNGKEGYIYAGECSYQKQITTDITLTGHDVPNGHIVGNTFSVTGTIASDYNYLDSAEVWVYNGFGTSGSKATGTSDEVNGYSYSLGGSTIDYATAFNSVTAGNHTYAISVSYTNYYAQGAQTVKTNTGTISLCEEYFVTIASAVNQSTCSHTYTTTTIQAATCTAGGVQVQACSTCGLVTEANTAASGHSYGAWTTVKATCTADGYKFRTCSVCRYEDKQTIPTTGHSYNMTESKATCNSYAVYAFTCGSCGDHYTLSARDMASEWLDYLPAGMSASLFTTKTQYRYSDYETITSTQESLPGYTLKNSEWVSAGNVTVDYVSAWPSGFDTSNSLYTKYNKASSKVTSFETATTRTTVNSDEKIGYLYYHWCSSSDSNHYSYNSKTSTHTIFHAYYSSTLPSEYACDTSDMSYKTSSSTCSNGNSAWFFVTEVYRQSYTTFNKQFIYERWTDFSEWSDTYVAANANRKVETRTVYQLKKASLGDHVWSNGRCTVCGSGCDHNWSNSLCTICGAACSHSWSNGVCSFCAAVCYHNWNNGKCLTCGKGCVHSWSNGRCNTCGMNCTHAWNNGKCSTCGMGCDHSWSNGKCTICSMNCSHSWSSGKCSTCGMGCVHSWSSGKCSTCGMGCVHSWSSGKCTTCGMSCPHSWNAGTCGSCGLVCTHSYTDGVCTVCGEKQPNQGYYLFGIINGQEYGCESDYANIGVYKFVDGQLVVTFQQDSYVAVKSGDNENWYMTKGWLGTGVKTAALYDSATISNGDKLYVPGGVEITFSLTKNSDGSLQLSYTTAGGVVVPTLSPSNISVSFEDELRLNVYFNAAETQDVVSYGLVTFAEKVPVPSHSVAIGATSGHVSTANGLRVTSPGIPAKKIGDKLYFSVYAELADGSYVYSKVYYYSPATYAYNMLNKSNTSASMKALIVAMLNYGAAAQIHFNYNVDTLVNKDLTAAQRALVDDYSTNMISGIVTCDAAKKNTVFAAGNTAFSSRTPSVSFEGAFALNFYMGNPKVAIGSEVRFYVWRASTYNSVSKLQGSNADAVGVCTYNGQYYIGVVDGIAAKEVDETVYCAAVFIGTDGKTYTSGIISYSLGAYIKSQATKSTTMGEFAKATGVYGYYAKQNFN